MNPENVGEPVKLRHSSLWRKPLQYEKPVPESNSCHHQLNDRTVFVIQLEPQDKAGVVAITSSTLTPQDSETNQS